MQGNEYKVNTGVPCPKCGLRLDAGMPVCPNDGTTVSTEPTQGELFDNKYLFLDRIGAGGMGVIFRARQQGLDRIVAIKMLQMATATPNSIRRFQQEAQALAMLDHPNLVRVYELGVTSYGQPYTVMEFVEGKALDAVVTERGRLSVEKSLNIFAQVLDGLQYVHEYGILHRDLKPSNIMLTEPYSEHPKVKLVDFGIAKIMDANSAKSLTQTGEVFGSPLYMSPEQAKGILVDQRSDIYSLGCVMYELLTGAPPFEGQTAVELILKQVGEKPKPLNTMVHGQKVPNSVEAIVHKMLEKEPIDRFQSIAEIKAELKSVMARTWYHVDLPSLRGRSAGRDSFVPYYIAGGVLLLGLLGIFAMAILAPDKNQPGNTRIKQFDLRDMSTNVGGLGNLPELKQKAADESTTKKRRKKSLLEADEPSSADKYTLYGSMIRSNGNDKKRNYFYTKWDCDNEYVGHQQVGDSDVALLHSLRLPLTEVNLNHTLVHSKSLTVLAQVPTLTSISFSGIKVEAKDLRDLTKLKRLRQLDLSNCGLNDNSLKVIGSMKQIESLYIGSNPRITSAGLAYLNQLPLFRLDIDRTGIDDKAGKILQPLNELNWLSVAQTNAGDGTLASVGRMSSMRLVNFADTKITDETLSSLKAPELATILLEDCKQITQSGIDAFRKNNPLCFSDIGADRRFKPEEHQEYSSAHRPEPDDE